jgi:hypothetical protein
MKSMLSTETSASTAGFRMIAPLAQKTGISRAKGGNISTCGGWRRNTHRG